MEDEAVLRNDAYDNDSGIIEEEDQEETKFSTVGTDGHRSQFFIGDSPKLGPKVLNT